MPPLEENVYITIIRSNLLNATHDKKMLLICNKRINTSARKSLDRRSPVWHSRSRRRCWKRPETGFPRRFRLRILCYSTGAGTWFPGNRWSRRGRSHRSPTYRCPIECRKAPPGSSSCHRPPACTTASGPSLWSPSALAAVLPPPRRKIKNNPTPRIPLSVASPGHFSPSSHRRHLITPRPAARSHSRNSGSRHIRPSRASERSRAKAPLSPSPRGSGSSTPCHKCTKLSLPLRAGFVETENDGKLPIFLHVCQTIRLFATVFGPCSIYLQSCRL